MEPITIDPGDGEDAAARLSGAAFEYLCRLILWELAIRTDRGQFEACLRRVLEERPHVEARLDDVRRERDRMRFIAEVMLDIARLPATEDETHEHTTGMYL